MTRNLESDPTGDSGKRNDELTPAVLRFLAKMRIQIATGDDLVAQGTELAHLVRLCRSFCGDLYLWNDSQSVDEPQWAQNQDARGREVTLTIWIEDYVLTRLEPFYGESEETIQAAADRHDFRWLGVHCREDLIKEIRKRRPKDGSFPRVTAQLPVNEGDPLSGLLATERLNMDFDYDPGESKISVDDIRSELDRLGLWGVFEEITDGREGSLPPGDITRNVAVRLGISERHARNKIKACRKVAERLAKAIESK